MFAQNSVPRLQAGLPGGFGSKLTREQQLKVLALTRASADHVGLLKEFCNVEHMYRNVKPKWWDMSARICFAGNYTHEHILEYAGRFLRSEGYARASVPLFAQLHLNAGHESTMRRVRTLDEGVARFLDRHAARREVGSAGGGGGGGGGGPQGLPIQSPVSTQFGCRQKMSSPWGSPIRPRNYPFWRPSKNG